MRDVGIDLFRSYFLKRICFSACFALMSAMVLFRLSTKMHILHYCYKIRMLDFKNAISNICGARKHEINFLTHLRLYIILCKEQRFVQVKIFNLLSWYVRTRRCASCASRLKTYSIFVFSIVSKLVLIGGGLFVKRKARYYFCKQHVRNICCLALLLSWNIVNK